MRTIECYIDNVSSSLVCNVAACISAILVVFHLCKQTISWLGSWLHVRFQQRDWTPCLSVAAISCPKTGPARPWTSFPPAPCWMVARWNHTNVTPTTRPCHRPSVLPPNTSYPTQMPHLTCTPTQLLAPASPLSGGHFVSHRGYNRAALNLCADLDKTPHTKGREETVALRATAGLPPEAEVSTVLEDHVIS